MSSAFLLLAVAGACLDTNIVGRGNTPGSPTYPEYVAIQAGTAYQSPNGISVFVGRAMSPPGIARVDFSGHDSSFVITGLRPGFAQWNPVIEGRHPVWVAVLGQRREAPTLVGHHGVPSIAPENTLAGVRAACQLGIPGIEVDVRVTADGIPVLIHDRDIRRTSNGTGYVDQMRFADLQQFDFGSWFSPQFAGEPILSLNGFLSVAAACDFETIQLDIKSFAPLSRDSGLVRIGRAVSSAGLSARVELASFDLYTLERGAVLIPGLHTLVFGGAITSGYADTILRSGVRAVGVEFDQYLASAHPLTQLDSAGITVGVWGPQTVLELNSLVPPPRFVTSDWGWSFAR